MRDKVLSSLGSDFFKNLRGVFRTEVLPNPHASKGSPEEI